MRVRFAATAASTATGDRLRAGKPPQYFAKPSRPAQPPTLSWTGNEYQPKCGDALLCGWGVKAGMVHSTCGLACGWQVKLCDPSLARVVPERLSDQQLIIKRYTN